MSNQRFIGIDNGLDGGICINDNGKIVTLPMPTQKQGKGRLVDVAEIAEIVSKHPDATFLLEEASKHSAGVLALCSTWFTFGSIKTILILHKVSYEIVRPQAWQKTFWARPKLPKGQKFDTKAAALNAATRIWPRHDWTKSERATKPHDGMVDAALIAEYGRRKLG